MNNKLYIPTTTLNFDNILSSESVSPKSFYSDRGFGFSRWFEITENDNNNIILLYDKPMGFSRPVSDVEDHPLLIEVTINERLKSLIKKVGEGVYSCTETIYIDLWNTRFIFQSEKEKQITLSLSDSSLETKVTRLYSKKMVVENLEGQYQTPQTHGGDVVANSSAIEFDIMTNKFKGLLYGYYIGAILSASKSNIEQLTLLKELRNVIAAVASNIEGKPTSYQTDMIMTITSQLNSFDYHQQALKQIISNKAECLKTIEYLITNNLLRSRFDGNVILQSLNTINVKDEIKNNGIIELVNREIEVLNRRISQESTPLNPDLGEIIVTDQKLQSIKNQSFQSKVEEELYKVWVNEIFTFSQYNSKINYYKEALTDTLTIRAKELLQEQWESSDIKIIMNKLRRHIRGENFDVEWNNGLLSSLAAVVTNGENWSKLLSFMQQKGMYDYRLAFSIYGMLNGFANLTRDFTDIILNYDKHYVADAYKEFYGQLFGISVDIIRDDSIVKDSHSLGSSHCKYNVIESQANQMQIENTDPLLKNELIKGQHYNDEKYLSEDYCILREYIENNNIVSPKPKGYTKDYAYDNIILKLKNYNGYWKLAFQDMYNDKKDGITLSTIDNLCSIFGIERWKPSKKRNKQNKTTDSNVGLFRFEEEHTDIAFYLDDNAFDKMKHLLSSNSQKDKIKEDVVWFQNEYKKGAESNYFAKARRDNQSVIDAFIRYITKKHCSIKSDELRSYLDSIYL